MNFVEIPLKLKEFGNDSEQLELLTRASDIRKESIQLADEEKYMDALERIVEAMRVIRDFPDFHNAEFQAFLVSLLFDLAEIHYTLHDYKQSEKELAVLFKVLDRLVQSDPERFGKYHILAMELSTRILRSRKKALDLLAKQQMNVGLLYEKVNAGVVTATDRLVDSLHKVGELLASAGDYKAALKFYAEAIKFSKKRSGRVTRKEVKMTLEMARIMSRMRQMQPRAKRLLAAILPHAIALETIELEQEILALMEIIDADIAREPKWKMFLHKISLPVRKKDSAESTVEADAPISESEASDGELIEPKRKKSASKPKKQAKPKKETK